MGYFNLYSSPANITDMNTILGKIFAAIMLLVTSLSAGSAAGTHQGKLDTDRY